MKLTESQEQARQQLLEICKPGDTIYTITRHVSRSGMQRRISAFVVKGGKIVDLDYLISHIGLFKRHNKYDGLVVNGCGMDMHFYLVYELGKMLYPEGFRKLETHLEQKPTYVYEPNGGYALDKVTL